MAEELDDARANVGGESEQIFKLQSIYAQDDGYVRRSRATCSESLEYILMIRVVVPGGGLTRARWLSLDRIAREFADGTIRLAAR